MKKPTPLGGRLVNRRLEGEERDKVIVEAQKFPRLKINHETAITIEMLATGVLSPLEGFMDEEDYRGAMEKMHLKDGTPWTLPITFAPVPHDGEADLIEGLRAGEKVALVEEENGKPLAIFHYEGKFAYDKEERAKGFFDTTSRVHPGVNNIFTRMGPHCLYGKVDLIERLHWGPFERYRLEPEDTWRIFYEERKWKSVVAFQTANPLHRGHEYLQKCALELHDGLFIQPIVETTKRAYFRNEFRLKAYEVAINTYYPMERVILAPLRVTMNYAGPREAIIHALIRRNFGCTHIILGRDHAGYKNFYCPYAAQKIFDEFNPEELGIEPLFFKNSFYCARCGSMASEKTCPHGPEYHLGMSGTGIQDILRFGYLPPKEVMRPEVAQISLQGIQPKGLDEKGQAVGTAGDTIKGLFPFFLTHHGLGGYKRHKKLEPTDLTFDDLVIALREARKGASRLYEELYEEMAHSLDIHRHATSKQKVEALEKTIEIQKQLIELLKEKVAYAPEKVQDSFMYQDKEEALRELKVAEEILEEISKPLYPEGFEKRVWNPMDYGLYRDDHSETGGG